MKDIEIYSGLLEEFIGKMVRPEAGQFRLEITTMRIILERSSRKDPLLMKVTLTDEGRLQQDLPDDVKSLQALRVYLEKATDFISSLMGEELARDFIGDFVVENENYIAENVIPRKAILEALPEPFKEMVARMAHAEKSSFGHQEILHLFTEVYNSYLKDLSKHTDLSAFKLKLGILREDHRLLRSMNLRKNNTIEIDVDGWAGAPDEEVGSALTSAFNSLVGLSSFLMGKEDATRKAIQALRENFDGREQLLSRYIQLDSLLEGALRQKVPTGIHLLDERMKGGLPKGASILLLSPGGIERDLFLTQMIGTGIDQGGSVIYVTSRDPPRSLRTLIRSSGMDPERLEEAGRLRIVDWFSWRGERIIGVERDGYALKSSKILSNLSIAIGKAIKEVRFSNIQIAIVQIISSAINIFDLPQVYNFIMKLRAKFKDEGISTVFLLEKESIGPEDLSKIREAFDGILELNRNETPKAIERDMVVHSMAGVDFDHRPVPMTIANGRLIAITSPSEPVDGNEVPSGQAAEAKVAKVVAGTRSRRSSTARQLAEDRLKVTGTNVVIVPPVQDATPVLPEDGEGGPVSDERTVILAPPVRMRPKMKRITVKRSTSGTKERRGGPPRPPERMIAEALSTIDDLLDTDTLDKAPAVRPKRVRKKI